MIAAITQREAEKADLEAEIERCMAPPHHARAARGYAAV